MANIRERLHLALLEKGIDSPVNNLAGMVGKPTARSRVNGHYYDTDDFAERATMEARQEIEALKSQARQGRSF